MICLLLVTGKQLNLSNYSGFNISAKLQENVSPTQRKQYETLNLTRNN